jgi:Cysteinyl-tRNA synthetase
LVTIAIFSAILGSNIDVHSGGVDLQFPHHENEEAQSCVYHGVDQWVNYWLHVGKIIRTVNS